MVILIDNYDSFVYNLGRYVGELGFERQVIRHDAITIADLQALKPSHIIISPGPCAPQQAGISLEVVQALSATVPILGVCLGHQAIAEAFGGIVARAKRPLHGKATDITHSGEGLFAGLPTPLKVGRYHSLIVEPETLPNTLKATAWSAEGEIMGLQHRTLPVYGVQFHPESVLTECGYTLLGHFLNDKSFTQNRELLPKGENA